MAKVRRNPPRSNSRNTMARRDLVISITNRPRLPRLLPSLVALSGQDFRRHVPSVRHKLLRDFSGSLIRPRVRFRGVPRNQYTAFSVYRRGLRSPYLSFDRVLPRTAVICARRQIRKEVIFAKGKAGRGGQRRPRRNEFSSYVCR